MAKLNVGVLGATGMVGQNYVRLLENHPWFNVTYVAASPRSAGKTYAEAVAGRWQMESEIPEEVKNLIVADANDAGNAKKSCDFVFTALEMEKEAIKNLEIAHAKVGLPVFSNASAHRWTEDVPMIIPEVNADHLDIIPVQKKNRGFDRGFIVVKPNCSLQSYITPVHALREAGYPVSKMIIATMQAVSGAGYPGVASLDIIDNVIPYIGGEEEKSEQEPKKIFGCIKSGKFVNDESIRIAAHCNRVPVVDGHTACVSLAFAGKKPSLDEIKKIWTKFTGEPQKLKLPMAPLRPIIYLDELNRPQPRKDRDNDKAMAVTVGRLRECPVFDIRFVGLSHNTVRGAAGGGILNAEFAFKRNLL